MDSISEAASSPRCSVCGIAFPNSDLIQYGNDKICASCKPAFFQRLKEGIKFVKMNKVILSSITLDMFAVLFGGAVALLPFFAGEIL